VGANGIQQAQPHMLAASPPAPRPRASTAPIVQEGHQLQRRPPGRGRLEGQQRQQRRERAAAGLLIAQEGAHGGFTWVSDQTTYAKDNNFVYNSVQAVYVRTSSPSPAPSAWRRRSSASRRGRQRGPRARGPRSIMARLPPPQAHRAQRRRAQGLQERGRPHQRHHDDRQRRDQAGRGDLLHPDQLPRHAGHAGGVVKPRRNLLP
jgi:hypothetical protein